MEKKTKTGLISRKNFLKLTVVLLSIYPAKLFIDLLGNSQNVQINGTQRFIPMDLPEGITFHNEIIAYQSGENIRFISSACPHLGCQINRLDKKQLVCPCHGSRFSIDGKILEGPATRDLSQLDYTKDSANQRYIVFLST